MPSLSRLRQHLMLLASTLLALGVDAVRFLRLCLRSHTSLAAENLFLRIQLAQYQARHTKPHHSAYATRIALVWLSHWFDWQHALTVVQPETFRRWRRQGFSVLWRGQSTPGRPPLPAELQALIRQMAQENLTWGQRRIANELRLKLGLCVSPRTVRKYTPKRLAPGPGQRVPSQRWRTFMRNHVSGLIASGAYETCLKGAYAVYGRVMRLLLRWRDGAKGRWSSPIAPLAPHEGFAVATLDGSSAMRHVEPMRRAAAMRNVERGPPRRHRPVHADPLIGVSWMGAGPPGVCLVAQKACGWIITTWSVRCVQPASDAGYHAISRRRAA
jgi:Homeodomain-like domain